MTPFVQDADLTIHVGDALTVLRTLPDESVHCCVTSPPYWGLRDYGTPGQLGLEATPDEYVAAIVAVFREVRRVLRADGTLWLNLGSSYASGTGSGLQGAGGQRADRTFTAEGMGAPVPPGYKPKDMVPIPWMVAMALQADGWYLRSDIVWAKPNPMPESVTDRPTKSHEYVFLLSRSPRYFFDAEAVRETNEHPRSVGRLTARERDGATPEDRRRVFPDPAGRNLRSVWPIATQPYPDAHFATFPEALPERCIKAGTSERGCCPECGAPWEREVEREPVVQTRSQHGGAARADGYDEQPRSGGQSGLVAAGFGAQFPRRTIGWSPPCGHEFAPVPCTVLDPFLGSGTTALVARRLARRCIGIELSPEYARLAADRTRQLSLLAEPA